MTDINVVLNDITSPSFFHDLVDFFMQVGHIRLHIQFTIKGLMFLLFIKDETV